MFAWTPELFPPDEPLPWSCPSCSPERVISHLGSSERLRLVKALQVSQKLTVRIHCHNQFPRNLDRARWDIKFWFFEVAYFVPSARSGQVQRGWMRKDSNITYTNVHELITQLEKGVF